LRLTAEPAFVMTTPPRAALSLGVERRSRHAAVWIERGGAITVLAITFARDTSLHVTPGYDDITSVGTPAPGYLDTYRHP
jgi:hypothetical protein